LFDGLYSGFQIDELHHHNQNLVGTLHATSLLWSTNMKTAVIITIQMEMILYTGLRQCCHI